MKELRTIKVTPRTIGLLNSIAGAFGKNQYEITEDAALMYYNKVRKSIERQLLKTSNTTKK